VLVDPAEGPKLSLIRETLRNWWYYWSFRIFRKNQEWFLYTLKPYASMGALGPVSVLKFNI